MAYYDKKFISNQMLEYYSETAKRYVINGKNIKEPDIPLNDESTISKYLSRLEGDHLIDIACGGGAWTSMYRSNIKKFTFLDRSETILDLCKARVNEMNLLKVSRFINCDISDYAYPANHFDMAFVGFLFSHFEQPDDRNFLANVKRTLKKDGKIIIVDSILTDEIMNARNIKKGIIRREVNGKFYRIYKNYFEKNELENLLKENSFEVEDNYFGSKVAFAIARNIK